MRNNLGSDGVRPLAVLLVNQPRWLPGTTVLFTVDAFMMVCTRKIDRTRFQFTGLPEWRAVSNPLTGTAI